MYLLPPANKYQAKRWGSHHGRESVRLGGAAIGQIENQWIVVDVKLLRVVH